jgi:hypothetical protein
MSTSASGSAAGYVSVLRYPVRFCVKNLLVSITYMVFMLRSHKHIHDVTNLFVIAIFWIKLLLKLPKFLTQYRPICLLNVSFKNFPKVDTNRITSIAQRIVRPTQTSFLPGRNIMEGASILHETIHELHTKKTRWYYYQD